MSIQHLDFWQTATIRAHITQTSKESCVLSKPADSHLCHSCQLVQFIKGTPLYRDLGRPRRELGKRKGSQEHCSWESKVQIQLSGKEK